MSKIQLKKHLSSLDKSEIIEFVLEMYDVHKDYFEYYLKPDERQQLEKYRKVIDREFHFMNGAQKFSVAKKAIADFTKLKPSEELIGELMMHLVKVGCKLTYDYGDYSENFYTALENNFDRALKFIAKNGLLGLFKDDAELCVKYASPCGYGFADTMRDIYGEYYAE